MFGSTAILPPRTKRWAEAKVLADCINLKVILSHSFAFPSDCQIGRSANYIYTTMSTHLHSPNTPFIQENSATSRVVGALAKRRLNFGVGSQDSEYFFWLFFALLFTDSPRDTAHSQSYLSMGRARP